MTNIVINPRYFAIPLISAAIMFIALPAKADQVFAYSDDLSSNFNLDMGQTRAKISSGMAFTADNSVSSDITSGVVANPSRAIVSARLDVSARVPSNTRIIYYISNNNGQRWMQINPGYTYSFDSIGNQLRLKAVITRDSIIVESASIDSIYLAYTVSDTLAVSSTNNIYNNYAYSGGVIGGISDPNSLVCNVLSMIGLGCGVTPPSSYVRPAPITTTATNSNTSNVSNNSGNNSNLTAAIYNAGAKNTNGNGSDIILVRIPKHEEIYEIVGGKKHLIPTKDIFYDYGFTDGMIQPITQQQLDRYPRVKVIQVSGDKKKNYYLTEGFMVRLIPHKTISDSYGDRDEDIIVISKKEFNYYPPSQFIFLERPLRRDVFQVVNGSKRYVTPMAVERMKIRPDDIAPVNETELTYYKTGTPIIF
ncbi:MAG: hypothetical protein HYT64_02120 [Candidatus Yanofskybacteria bacterium]|nr:hypothetical protein [Candidatus Yanofskybacteria bacterium]